MRDEILAIKILKQKAYKNKSCLVKGGKMNEPIGNMTTKHDKKVEVGPGGACMARAIV